MSIIIDDAGLDGADGKNVYVTVEGGSDCGIWWYVHLGGSEVGASKKDLVLR